MDGSESAVFRVLDTIRINKLDTNNSGFCVLSHDLCQKPFAFGAPGRNRTCDPASETSTDKKYINTLNNYTLSKTS